MKSSQEPFQERDSNLPANQVASEQVPEALTFEQELEAVERSLHSLRDRSLQVQQDQQLETQLQERQEQIKRQFQRSSSPELKDELKNIQNRLDELEVNLESRLFSWGSLKEPFWQIVRFGGLGVVLGWFLAFAVIQSPKPTPQSSMPASQSSQP
jgi:seryl-tRNA synthetase